MSSPYRSVRSRAATVCLTHPGGVAAVPMEATIAVNEYEVVRAQNTVSPAAMRQCSVL